MYTRLPIMGIRKKKSVSERGRGFYAFVIMHRI